MRIDIGREEIKKYHNPLWCVMLYTLFKNALSSVRHEKGRRGTEGPFGYTPVCSFRILLINPARYHGLNQGESDLAPSLNFGILRGSRNMQEKRVAVLTLLKCQGQARVEDKITQVVSGILGYAQICVGRRERSPHLEEIIIWRIGSLSIGTVFNRTAGGKDWW